MKKYLFSFAVMMTGMAFLTGCTNDDNKNNTPIEYVYTEGVLIINNGSWNHIDGSLTALDLSKSPFTAQQNVYKNANGTSLGGTPNDVLVYGQKVYIAGADENAVFVVDKKTFKLIKKVSTVESMGEADGINPRHLECYGGKVYVSTYGGYVGVIDTLSMNITTKYKVGVAPEGMAVGGTSASDAALYVANSGYGMGNASITKINLANGTITEIKNELIRNPQELAVAGDVVYVLDWGYYDENYNQKEAGVYMINGNVVTKVIPDATGMAAAGRYIYTFNFPYGSSKATYSIYNITSGSVSSLSLTGDKAIVSPSAIGIDPVSNYVFIASRPLDPDTGYASYQLPGYVNIYSATGTYVGTYDAGIEPHAIAFTYGTATYIPQ